MRNERNKILKKMKKKISENRERPCWDPVVKLERNDACLTLKNLYTHFEYLLDEIAPYKKLTKREFKGEDP